MLEILDEGRCSRRRLLTCGGLGAMAALWCGSLRAAPGPLDALTGRSVIFVFQQGGPSQLETFDPKPEASESVRTLTGTIGTAISGVRFGDSLERLAALADRLTIVRSYQTNNGGHNIQPLVGPDSRETQLGVHYSRVAGATRADGVPTNMVLYPRAVDDAVPGPEARGDLTATGTYGKAYAPFVPGSGGELQQDMQLRISPERLVEDRREVLRRLDRLRADLDAAGQLAAVDAIREQAYQLLLGGGVSRALDLSLEDPRTLARYDTRPLVRRGAWNKANRGQRGYYDAQGTTIGRLLLLARRLCEAGCGFVTVHAGYAGVWDMHADGNNLNMVDGMQAVGRTFDHAVAALIADLEERGLRDRVLVVCSGEMGRTPRVNARGGRDHWGKLSPLLLAGGGLAPGVIGQSTRDGGEPLTEPHAPRNLIATLLGTLLDVPRLRLVDGLPPQVLELAQAPGIGVRDGE